METTEERWVTHKKIQNTEIKRADGQLLTQWKFPNLGLQFMIRVMKPMKGLPGFEELVKAWIWGPGRGR
jgi:hypothetical protein